MAGQQQCAIVKGNTLSYYEGKQVNAIVNHTKHYKFELTLMFECS